MLLEKLEVRVMVRYFAYGSVLSKRHVGEWAGEHGVDARLFARGAPAVLRGYALTFDVESRFWGGRVADLREDRDGVVHGVLFEIPVPARDSQDALARTPIQTLLRSAHCLLQASTGMEREIVLLMLNLQ